MAYYLVSARARAHLLPELESRLAQQAFMALEPFGPTLSASLEAARQQPDGSVVWEEEDYCRPPLAQERAAVLDRYFEGLSVEPVEHGSGWRRIAELPPLFPTFAKS
jgi:hypothetical protein